MEQLRSAKFHLKRWKIAIFLVGSLILTAWNLTRSAALLEARHAYLKGDLALCLRNALDHLGRQPWSSEAALLAASCLSRLDYAGDAEPYFRRAGHLTLNDLQIRAHGLARGSHPEQAIPVYEEILATRPDNMTALRGIAAVELLRNNKEKLLKLAEQFSRLSGGAVIGHMLRGVVYHRDNNPSQAVTCFERVLELDPELLEMPLSRRLFWSHFADDLIAIHRIDDAGRVLTKAVAHGPDADLINRLGRVYLLQGRFEDAERYFRQAAEWSPSDYNSYLNLFDVALRCHRREEALKYLNQARLLAPRESSVLCRLASAYRQLGRPADAACVQELITQLGDQPATSSRLANSPWPRHAL
jgi:tetratricopeptide (TPR) repeat protein